MGVNRSVGIPVLSVNIINSGDTYSYKVGDTINGATVVHPYETEVVTGKVLAMHLFDKADVEGNSNIIDGIESGKYVRKYPEMKTVEEEFDIDTLLLDVSPVGALTQTRKVIKVAEIDSISSYTKADGSVIEQLTPTATGTYNLQSSITSSASGSVLKMRDGSVTESLEITKSITIRGTNAGVAQN